MSRFFDMNNPFFQFLGRVADLMILNIIFLITCIPIVTIGAAWTSLYYVTLKMVRNEESYIVRSYFKSFKENFKQATVMWLIVLVLLVLLFFDYRIISVMETSLNQVIQVGLTAVGLVLAMMLSYLFPLLSKFYNSIKHTFTNALLMSIRHLPQTIIMIVITVAAVVVTFLTNWTFVYGTLVWLMCGFATIALANSWFLVKIFDKYIPETAEESADSAEAVIEPSVFKNLSPTAPGSTEEAEEETE